VHRQATTLGKLLTPMCLCHQAVQFGTRQRAVMLCGWEGNRRSGIALAMRHRLSWFIHLGYGLNGHRQGDEHPAYAPNWDMAHFTFTMFCSGSPCLYMSGTFKVQTKALGRRVRCFYNVVEPGQYTVEVTWSGDPVPQSPYSVIVFASDEELDSYVAATSLASTSDGSSSTVSRASSCSVQ